MRIAAEHSEQDGPPPSLPQNPAPRRLVWSEHLPPAEVAKRETLDLLECYGLEVAVAIRPGDERDLPRLLDEAAARGITVHLWPMLRNEDGRWLSEHNAELFAKFVGRMLESLGDRQPQVVLDLEPPIETMRQWIRHPTRIVGAAAPSRRRPTHVRDVVDALKRQGVEPWAAVVPLLLADPIPGHGGWHALMGTPVDPQDLSRLSAMLYSSIALGYGRGWLRRADVRSLLFETARACVRRWGPRAGASVGAVGPGALQDERVYDDPSELAEDVGLVRAAGIEDIGLFELQGVLQRPPAERWLDALCHTEPTKTIPTRSRRALVAIGLAVGLGQLLKYDRQRPTVRSKK
jgi:hypothetical protein